MSDWKDDKDLGPWAFTEQPDKWGYLNNPRWKTESEEETSYTGRESEEPQIWTPEGIGGPYSKGDSITHLPCGHWHKKSIITNEVEIEGGIETYIYLLGAGVQDSASQLYQPEPEYSGEDGPIFDAAFLSTFRNLNTNDFVCADGEVSYFFEAVCKNKSELNTGYVYLVDSDSAVKAAIPVPKQSWGPIGLTSLGGELRSEGYYGSDYFAFRTEFTPNVGLDSYGLRVMIPNSGWLPGWAAGESILKVTEAVIVIRQTYPTKSLVHIPMLLDVNAANMNYDTIDKGAYVKTNGRESLAVDMGGIANYVDCEVAESTFYQNRQVWKFDTTELNQVSKVVFDAGVGYYASSVSPSVLYVTGIPNLFKTWIDLRWCSTGGIGAANFTSGAPQDTVASDGTYDFYYIEGSYSVWSADDDGVPCNKRVYLNTSSLTAADGKYLYVCSNVDVYGNDTPSGPYHHWGQYRAFSIPDGRSVTSAWIDYYAYYDPAAERNKVKVTFCYTLDDEINPAYIILYDKTADSYVSESELVWNTSTPWERKTAEFSPALLTSGHEYVARWKCGTVIDDWTADPLVSDINLTFHVEEVSKFTAWRRVVKSTAMNLVFSAWIYSDWIGDFDPSYTNAGCINVLTRARLFLPSTLDAYLEICGFEYSWGEKDISSLWSCGEDDNGIGTTVFEEVIASRITWGGDLSGLTYRQRSEKITELVNNYRYIDHSPATADYNVVPLSGFIVIRYI